MSKKNFSNGINAFFNEDIKSQVKSLQETHSTSTEKRATFVIEIDLFEKIKAVAYWERKTVKSILKESLDCFFSSKGEDYISQAIDNYHQARHTPHGIE